MDVFKAISERSSIRSYKGEPVDQDDMEKIIEAARKAPSAKNLQPWKLIVVRDPISLEEMVGICQGQQFVKDAGALIVGLTEQTKWAQVDISIALDHLSLEAVELGYGTCWIGAFDKEAMEEKLGVSEDLEAFICMTIGVPDDETDSPTKKSLDELVEWIKVE